MKLKKIRTADTADTVANLGDTVADLKENFDPEGATADYSQETPVGGNEVVAAQQYLNDIDTEYRAGNDPNTPLDVEQRIDLALRDSKRAADVSSDTARVLNNLSNHVTKGFAQIGQQLDQLASGEPAQKLPEPGASVFDEE